LASRARLGDALQLSAIAREMQARSAGKNDPTCSGWNVAEIRNRSVEDMTRAAGYGRPCRRQAAPTAAPSHAGGLEMNRLMAGQQLEFGGLPPSLSIWRRARRLPLGVLLDTGSTASSTQGEQSNGFSNGCQKSALLFPRSWTAISPRWRAA
jgi:hypothetical protein